MTVSLLHSVPADGSFSAAGAAAWDAQHVLTQATDRLLGRTTAGVGATEEITVGAGLTLLGGTLVNAGATSPIGGSNTQVQFNDGGVFAGNANFTFDKTTNQIAIAAGTAAAPTLIPTGDTNTGMWFPAADTIAASTTGIERMRITSSGNVGIGTTSPIYLLHLYSSAGAQMVFQSDSTCNFLLERASTDATSAALNFRKYRGTIASQTTVASGDVLGLSNYTGFDGTANRICATITGAVETYTGTNDVSGNIRFGTRGTGVGVGVSERLRITGSGNVGIGTTAPDALLSVNGIASFGAGAAATPSLAAFGDLNTGMWFPAADTIAWSTGGSERMRINSSGNVGIGTSSPSQKLDVSGSIITSQSITIGTGGSFTAGSIASNVNWGMYFQAKQASPNLGHFTWTTSAVVELLRINSSGVLILGSGEASATVAGNTLRAPSSSGTNIAGGNLTIAGGAGTGTGGGGHIAFQTAAAGSTGSTANTLTERLRITSAGNFGINTTAPDALLSVNGIASFGAGAAATPSITAFGDLNTGMWFPAADTIAASTGGAERLRVDANGNVVINTAAIATAATDGFLYVPSCAGTPTGTPTTFTGRVPIVVDTTNNKLYFYSGGQWRDAGP